MKHWKIYLIAILVLCVVVMPILIIIPGKKTTFSDHGDVWHELEDENFKVEWRHINNAEDTMAVIHIHQGDSLYTWVGKPCQCY